MRLRIAVLACLLAAVLEESATACGRRHRTRCCQESVAVHFEVPACDCHAGNGPIPVQPNKGGPTIQGRLEDKPAGAAPFSCLNGTCINSGGYCQMCCGNQYYYIDIGSGRRLTCPFTGQVEVNCGGQRYYAYCP